MACSWLTRAHAPLLPVRAVSCSGTLQLRRERRWRSRGTMGALCLNFAFIGFHSRVCIDAFVQLCAACMCLHCFRVDVCASEEKSSFESKLTRLLIITGYFKSDDKCKSKQERLTGICTVHRSAFSETKGRCDTMHEGGNLCHCKTFLETLVPEMLSVQPAK